MNWEAIGAIGEILGALTVIGSLIFVGSQIRQHTAAVRTSTSQSHVEGYNSIIIPIFQDKDVARLWRIGLEQGVAGLDEDDGVRFLSIVSTLLRYFDASYLQFQRKSLEPDLWNTIEKFTILVTNSPGFSDWWSLRNHTLSEDFRLFVSEAMHSENSVPLLYKPSSESSQLDTKNRV